MLKSGPLSPENTLRFGVADRLPWVLSPPFSDFPMTLPLARNAFIAGSCRSFAYISLIRGGSSLAIALLLSSCGTLPWRAEAPLRPVARRRAVPASQRQEARMARPISRGSLPVVDYGVYKRIHPGMELSQVQSLLGHEGQGYEEGGAEANAPTTEAGDATAGVFWRWTHPSGVYNIHLRLSPGSQPETFAVQSKWLTYNPPE